MRQKMALIVGAGLGGLVAAHALHQVGWQSRVLERAAAFGEVGAGIQLTPNATRVLARLGLLEAVRAAAFSPRAAVLRQGCSGRVLMAAPLQRFCARVYGAPYLHITRPRLHTILTQGLEIDLACPVKAYEADGICLADGQCITGDLIVGADGLRSTMQRQMNGPARPCFTGQVAWRSLVLATPDLRRRLPPDATVWTGIGQHLVTYFVDPDLLNVVAVTEHETWRQEGWDVPGDPRELRARFAAWHPDVQAALEGVQQVRRWALFDRKPLPRWVDGKTALLGDAAHPMLPFLAQGAAQAFEDAWVLACHASNLPAYETIRKPRTTKIQSWARSNAALYHQRRRLDRLKLQAARLAFRGPQAHILFWQIFR